MQGAKRVFIRISTMTLKGMLVGITNLIPGASGGTIAYLLRVYFPTLHALHTLLSLGTKKRAAFSYIWPLFSGILLGILCFSRLLEWLINTHSLPISWLFLGLVLGSIPSMFHMVAQYKCRSSEAVSLILCFLLAASIPLFPHSIQSAENPLFLYLSVTIATISMMIPGISGSLVLLLLGNYAHVLEILSTLHIPLLLLLLSGFLSGLLAFIMGVRRLLIRFPSQVLWGASGFVLASPVAILSIASSASLLFRLCSLLIGIAISISIYVITRKK